MVDCKPTRYLYFTFWICLIDDTRQFEKCYLEITAMLEAILKADLTFLFSRSNNPVLLGFLSGIQKLAVTESGLKDLISRTLSAAPDLVIPFLSRLDLNLELKESPQWRNNITFVTGVLYCLILLLCNF